MGFYTTDERSAVLESHQGNQTHPSKNRVWDFFTTSETCAGVFELQPVESHQEKWPTPTTTVSGVRYYGYRYYQPQMGRWTSRDPIGDLGFLSQYLPKLSTSEAKRLLSASPDARIFVSQDLRQRRVGQREPNYFAVLGRTRLGQERIALAYLFLHNDACDMIDPLGDNPLVGCAGGAVIGGIGGAIGGIAGGLKGCACGALGGAVNGCITGLVCAGAPALCLVGGCIGGFLGSVSEQLCLNGTALNNTCAVASAIINTGLGCLGGSGISDVAAKEKMILWVLGIDISALNNLCGLTI